MGKINESNTIKNFDIVNKGIWPAYDTSLAI